MAVDHHPQWTRPQCTHV